MSEQVMDLGGSWLHRLFVLRQLVDAHLDKAFVSVPWPKQSRIVFYNEVDAGLGDVAFMTKLLKLVAATSGAPTLVLVTTGIEKQRKFSLPDSVHVLSVQEAVGHPWVDGCDLVVSAPGIFDHCRSGPAVLSALGLPANTPFLYLAEYGSIRQLRDDAFKPLISRIEDAREQWIDELARSKGFDPEETGFRAKSGEVVALDADGQSVDIGSLNEFFLNVSIETNPLAEWMGQAALSARSCGLEPGELGVHVDVEMLALARRIRSEPSLRHDIARQLEEPSVREVVCAAIDSNSRVFMGYAHSGHRVFHDLLSAVCQDDAGDVVLVVPDARVVSRIIADDFPPALLARMAARGVGRIEVVGRRAGADGTGETAEHILGVGRTWRIVTTYPLSHADMKRLMVVSEPPTMVSGDQSFSDAVSALKALAVIEPVYCQTWHLDAVCALAGEIDSDVAAMLKAGLTFEWQPEHMDNVLGVGRTREFWSHVAQLSERIVEHHNVNELIVATIRRAVWASHERVGPGLVKWLSHEVRRCLEHVRPRFRGSWHTSWLGHPPVIPPSLIASAETST